MGWRVGVCGGSTRPPPARAASVEASSREAASREVCLEGGCLDGGCLEGGCLEGGCLDPPPARPGGRAALPAPPGEAVVWGGQIP